MGRGARPRATRPIAAIIIESSGLPARGLSREYAIWAVETPMRRIAHPQRVTFEYNASVEKA